MTPNSQSTRNPLGWISLGLMFAYLVGTQLMASFEEPKPKDLLRGIEQRATMTVRMQSLLKMAPGSTSGAVEAEANYRKSILGQANQLSAKLPENVAAVALETALRLEASAKPRQEALVTLAKSDLPKYTALAEAATLDDPEPDQARGFADAMAGDELAMQLARAVVLERGGLEAERPGYGKNTVLMLGALMLLVLVGVLASWLAWFIWRSMNRTHPKDIPGLPTGPISRVEADGLALRGALMFGVFLFGSLLASTVALAFGTLRKDAYNLLAILILVVGVVWISKLRIGGRKWSLRDLGLRTDRPMADVVWGVGAAFANIPLLIGITLLSQTLFSGLPEPTHPIQSELVSGGGTWRMLLLFAQASLLAPWFEEILFRGTLFPALARVTRSVPRGIVISGFLFAAIHPQGLAGWPALMVLGMVMAYLCAVRRSLVPAIVMHAVHNTGLLVLNLLLSG